MKEQEFLHYAELDRVTLQAWITEAWLVPAESAGERDFSDVDLARARLIHELQKDMGVNEPGVGVILHLLDQLHGLRRAMKELLVTAHEKSTPRAEG